MVQRGQSVQKEGMQFMFKQDAAAIAGADEIEEFILLYMQRSPYAFELGQEGAGFDDESRLACIAPGETGTVAEKEDGKHG